MKNCVNLLLEAFDCDKKLKKTDILKDNIFYGLGCAKKWIANIVPYDVLKLDIKDSINLIMTLSEDKFYDEFPEFIETPNYGDNWGRFANYIEINNRAMANMNDERTCCGTINMIKLLPAIPPSARSFANCIIISQVFPNIFGDSYNKAPDVENSMYGLVLNSGYSKNIITQNIELDENDQLRALCDLAHFRGIKIGFRTIISADQMKVNYKDRQETFSWDNDEHLEIYIQEMTKLMNLGFECMFIDSAKHIGGYDMEHYTGVGKLPEYGKMQYILNEIRKRSMKTNISFVGEKSTDDFERYKNMGLTSGTDYITGDDFEKVKNLSEQLKYLRDYAPGVEIENDNYEGGISYEQRLNRISTALFAYNLASDKLPSFMQTNDIFPLRYDTNTHHIMMTNPSYSTDGTPLSHIKNLFAEEGRDYNKKVGELFANAICR